MQRDRRRLLLAAAGVAVAVRPLALVHRTAVPDVRIAFLSGESMPLRLAAPDPRFLVVDEAPQGLGGLLQREARDVA